MATRKILKVLIAAASVSLSACGGQSTTTTASSTKTPASVQTATPTPTPTPSPKSTAVSTAALASFQAEMNDQNGYTGSSTLVFYQPFKAGSDSVPHPAKTSFQILPYTDKKKTNNTWIMPFSATITNTTKGYDVNGYMNLSVNLNNNIQNIAGRYPDVKLDFYSLSQLTTDVYLYIDSSWTQLSSDTGSSYNLKYTKSVKSENLKSGSTWMLVGYLVLNDIDTPRCQDGLPFFLWPYYYIDISYNLSTSSDSQVDASISRELYKKKDGTSAGTFAFCDYANQQKEMAALWKSYETDAAASAFVKK